MLQIPLQRGKSVDVNSGFYALLLNEYDEQTVHKLTPDIASYQQLRDNASLVADPTDASIQLLLKLHYHYSVLVPRLNGYQNELRVSFRWQDGYRSSKSIMSNSLYVDWACFLWNLGAFESQLGAKCERTSDEGIKTANKHFQQAAGYFDYIQQQILPKCTGSVLVGLTHQGLSMAKDLMLAQAQLCFYEKAVRDKKAGKMKPAVIAKLARQTSLFFDSVKHYCLMEPLVSTLDPSWQQHAEFQSLIFLGASEYWQGITSKEIAVEKGSGYAEEIVRLSIAQRYVSNAVTLARQNNLTASTIQSGEGLLHTIETTKNKSIQENNTIYMEPLPAEKTLVAIAPVAMVKALPLPTTNTEEKGYFVDVLPSKVRQLRQEYETQVNHLLTQAVADVGASSNQARLALSALGLPGSLEAFKSGGRLPDSLWSKIQRFQQTGGKQELFTKVQTIDEMVTRIQNSLNGIETALDREEKADQQFRLKYSHWQSNNNTILDIKYQLRQMKEAFNAAQVTDDYAKKELNDVVFNQGLHTLSMNQQQIAALLPKPAITTTTMGTTTNVNGEINTLVLESKLIEMASIIESRERVLAAMQKFATNDIGTELMQIYVNNSSNNNSGKGNNVTTTDDAPATTTVSIVEPVHELQDHMQKKLQELQPFLSQLGQLQQQQPLLLQEITNHNNDFQRAIATSATTINNNNIIQELEQHLARYFNVSSQLSAGITFYGNYQTRLTQQQQQADDLCYLQQLQRNEFEANLNNEIARATQEKRDREYAEKLASELQQQCTVGNPFTATTNYGQPQQYPQQQQQQQHSPHSPQYSLQPPVTPTGATTTTTGIGLNYQQAISGGLPPAPYSPVPYSYPTTTGTTTTTATGTANAPIQGVVAGYQYNPVPTQTATTTTTTGNGYASAPVVPTLSGYHSNLLLPQQQQLPPQQQQQQQPIYTPQLPNYPGQPIYQQQQQQQPPSYQQQQQQQQHGGLTQSGSFRNNQTPVQQQQLQPQPNNYGYQQPPPSYQQQQPQQQQQQPGAGSVPIPIGNNNPYQQQQQQQQQQYGYPPQQQPPQPQQAPYQQPPYLQQQQQQQQGFGTSPTKSFPGQAAFSSSPSNRNSSHFNNNNGYTQQMPQQQSDPNEIHAKALKLVDMGFSYEHSMTALQANNYDELAALNSLLTSPPLSPAEAAAITTGTTTTTGTATATAATTSTSEKKGLFGIKWGSKK